MKLIMQFRYLILLLIASTQIFSSVFFVPGGEALGLSVFRFILIVSGISFMLLGGFGDVSSSVRRVLLASISLLFLMLVSLWWSKNIAVGIRQVAYLGTTILLIYNFDRLIRTVKDFSWFTYFVIFLAVGIIIFAFYELETGNHFYTKTFEVALRDRSLQYMLKDNAWFTFGNPNDLAAHLVLCSLFGLFLLKQFNFWSLLLLVFVCVCVYLSERLQARLALLALLTFMGVYFTSLATKRLSGAATVARLAAIAAVILLVTAVTFAELAGASDVSTLIRLQLISSAVQMSAQTLLVGVGSGSFEMEMILRGMSSLTYGIVNPHNALGRILAENGIIGLLLFSYLIFGPIAVVARAGRTTRLSAFAAATPVCIFLLQSISSDPLSASSLQLAIAVAWVAARLATDLERSPPAPNLQRGANMATGSPR